MLAALAEAILASAGMNLDMGGGCGHWRTGQRAGAILAGAGRAGRAGASPPCPCVFADERITTHRKATQGTGNKSAWGRLLAMISAAFRTTCRNRHGAEGNGGGFDWE
jgi:hypothetical protein